MPADTNRVRMGVINEQIGGEPNCGNGVMI